MNLKNFASLLVSMIIMSSTLMGAPCDHEYRRWKDFAAQRDKWGVGSVAVARVGWAAGGVWGLAGIIPGAVAARFDKMARDAKRDYDRCIDSHNEAQKKAADEEAKKREKEAKKREADARKKIEDIKFFNNHKS